MSYETIYDQPVLENVNVNLEHSKATILNHQIKLILRDPYTFPKKIDYVIAYSSTKEKGLAHKKKIEARERFFRVLQENSLQLEKAEAANVRFELFNRLKHNVPKLSDTLESCSICCKIFKEFLTILEC